MNMLINSLYKENENLKKFGLQLTAMTKQLLFYKY